MRSSLFFSCVATRASGPGLVRKLSSRHRYAQTLRVHCLIFLGSAVLTSCCVWYSHASSMLDYHWYWDPILFGYWPPSEVGQCFYGTTIIFSARLTESHPFDYSSVAGMSSVRSLSSRPSCASGSFGLFISWTDRRQLVSCSCILQDDGLKVFRLVDGLDLLCFSSWSTACFA